MNMISSIGIKALIAGHAKLASGEVAYITHLPEICSALTLFSLLVLGGTAFVSRTASRPLNPCFLASASRKWGTTGLCLLNVCAWSLLFSQVIRWSTFEALSSLAFLAAFMTALATIVAALCAHLKIKKSNGTPTGTGIADRSLLIGHATIMFCLAFDVAVDVNLEYRFKHIECINSLHPVRSSACVLNLRLINVAKKQWALEFRKTESDMPTMTDLAGTDKYIKVTPQCPAGGTYILGNIRTKSKCSMAGHALP